MDYIKVFKGNTGDSVEDNSNAVKGALDCMNRFSQAFENEDLEKMDDCLQFPHYMISGNEVVCWDKKGQLTKSFFDDLKKQGFKKTVVDYIEVILASEDKVHLKYGYSRISKNDEIMSKHDNVWILTKVNEEWKILIRSY